MTRQSKGVVRINGDGSMTTSDKLADKRRIAGADIQNPSASLDRTEDPLAPLPGNSASPDDVTRHLPRPP
jgi:hypothetical protein